MTEAWIEISLISDIKGDNLRKEYEMEKGVRDKESGGRRNAEDDSKNQNENHVWNVKNRYMMEMRKVLYKTYINMFILYSL